MYRSTSIDPPTSYSHCIFGTSIPIISLPRDEPLLFDYFTIAFYFYNINICIVKWHLTLNTIFGARELMLYCRYITRSKDLLQSYRFCQQNRCGFG